MTGIADLRQARCDASHADVERDKATGYQSRPLAGSAVAGWQFGDKAIEACGRGRAPGEAAPRGTEAHYDWSFDCRRVDDGRESR